MANNRESLTGQFTPDLQNPIGEGNTSIIFPARKGEGPFIYAMKLLKNIEDEMAVKRFREETAIHRQLQRVGNRNILPFHQGGYKYTPDGSRQHYIITLKANDGSFLESDEEKMTRDPHNLDVPRVRRFPVVNLADYLDQGANGLQSVHDEGFIDNDVNPSNFLLHQYQDEDNKTVLLTDFGLSQSVNNTEPSMAGDVFYMAPEKGKRGTVTKSVDLYGLGVVAYEMLTGELPFEIPKLSASERQKLALDPNKKRDMQTLIKQKHNDDPIPFSRRLDITQFPDPEMIDLRFAVEEDVIKSLATNPADRQGSVGDFREDLKQHFDRAVILHNKHRTTITGSGTTSRSEQTSPSGDATPRRRSTLKAPDFLDQRPKVQGTKPKETTAKKNEDDEETLDRRQLLKRGAGAVGVLLGVGYLGVSLKNGLSDGRRDRTSTNESADEQPEGTPTNNETAKPTEQPAEDNLLTLAHEGITSFQQAEEIGFAGQIASFIGDEETARQGLADLQANEAYGYAGDVAARIGDTKTAREMMAKSRQTEGSSASGYTAALLDDKEIARQDIAILQNEGEYGAAGVIAALIGDEDTAVQAIQAEENLAYNGEIHALLNKPEDAAIIVAELNAMGQYRNVGRIAAILGDKEGVETAITNIQNTDLSGIDPIAAMNPEGFAGYLAAEAIWWKKRREEQGL